MTKLQKLYERCTPLPLEIAIGKHYCFHDTTRVAIQKVREPSDDNPEGSGENVAEVWPGDNDIDKYDAIRFVHAVTMLPRLVEALELVLHYSRKEVHALPATLVTRVTKVLAEANNPEGV